MEEKFIKNIAQGEILTLASLVEADEGQVVSKTLAQNDYVSLTLFSFDKGEEISTHASDGDALVTILEGSARITIDGTEFLVQAGSSIVMPAKKPHALYAVERFKMSLTVIFDGSRQR